MRIAIATLSLSLLPLGACQRIKEPVPTPTTDQWRRVQESLIDTLPETAQRLDAQLGDHVRLVGWEIEPAAPQLSGEVALTLYWETTAPIEDRWRIFVHLDQQGARQNLDHEAVNNVYATVYWEPGKIIVDRVEGTLSGDLRVGEVSVLVGMFRDDPRLSDQDRRMAVTQPGTATVESDGRLRIGAFNVAWEPPRYAARFAAPAPTLDGRASDRAWNTAQRLDLTAPQVDDAGTWAKLLWDDEAVYVLMNTRDTDIWATFTDAAAALADEEAMSVALAPTDGAAPLVVTVNPRGTFAVRRAGDDTLVDFSGVEAQVAVNGNIDDRNDRDRSWTAELRVPRAAIGAFTDSLEANVVRYDRPATGDAVVSAWAGAPAGTNGPFQLGVVTLAPRPEPAADGSGGSGEGSAPGAVAPRLERLSPR